jgi:hypothetical protein
VVHCTITEIISGHHPVFAIQSDLREIIPPPRPRPAPVADRATPRPARIVVEKRDSAEYPDIIILRYRIEPAEPRAKRRRAHPPPSANSWE